jgi:hypothetical protein
MWKEQFEDYLDDLVRVVEAHHLGNKIPYTTEEARNQIKSFISTQMEKLIEEIPDDIHDAALGTRIGFNATSILKQRLKSKWLN